MSTTRLLVLGAVRIFQPAHGYLVRRELVTWQVDDWANLNPGSIYNALRTLARDGLLEEAEAEIAVGGTGPGARVTYRLTPDGVVFVDQHSAHERVLYEALMREFSAGQVASQRLLLPITVEILWWRSERDSDADFRGVGSLAGDVKQAIVSDDRRDHLRTVGRLAVTTHLLHTGIPFLGLGAAR